MHTNQRTGSNPVNLGDAVLPSDRIRYQRMARVIRLMDQMLTYDIDTVAVEASGPAPAWTKLDGDHITINAGMMPGLWSRTDVAVWLGTNAHEVFHSLYTPRAGTKLVRRVQAAQQSVSPTMWRSFNVLEDQRIERLGLTRFGKWRGYLIAALSHHIDAGASTAWLLLAGRTWLPQQARDIARAKFVQMFDEGSADYAARLIGSYQRLLDPAGDDASEAYDIIVEFNEAFGGIAPEGTCGKRPTTKGDESDTEVGEQPSWPAADEEPEEEESEEDELEDGDEEDDGEGEPEDEGDEPDDGGEPCPEGEESDEGEPSDDGDDEGDGDGSDDSDDAGDDDGDADDGVGDPGDSDEPGDGTGKPDGVTRTLRGALKDAVNDALDDDDTADDLDRVVDQVEHGTPGRAVDCRRTDGVFGDVTPAARLLARDVTEVLVQIKDDNEAAWVRRTDSGRLNVDRWINDVDWDPDEAFDLFDPGAMDASSLDCTLVLDVSASMSAQMFKLAEATWAIRRAVDRVEGECTVFAFGDDVSLMFGVGSRPDGRLFMPALEGSTNPTPGCRMAHQMVASSTATNRIVIVMTDGQWYDAEPAEAAMQACRDAGAIVALVGLGPSARKPTVKLTGADITVLIDDPAELVPLFKDLAERSMKAAAGR